MLKLITISASYHLIRNQKVHIQIVDVTL
jgi:hypothetical protein